MRVSSFFYFTPPPVLFCQEVLCALEKKSALCYAFAMTLVVRNRLFLAFFICSVIYCACLAGVFIYSAFFAGTFLAPDAPIRTFSLFSSILTYRFTASIAGIFLFLLYVPLTVFILYFHFEKTQSLEILFFAGFLLGILPEGLRILIPVDALWQTSSTTLIILGRAIISGRMLTHLSLLFASLFVNVEHRQSVERNCIIVFLVAVAVGFLYPLNTQYVTTTCTVLWGYRTMFTILRVFLFLLSLSSIIIRALVSGSADLYREALGYGLLMIGYSLLTVSDSYVLLIASGSLLVAGTVLYLQSIHRQYLWL